MKESILLKLGEKLMPYGFKLKKSTGEFTKKTINGWHRYLVLFYDKDGYEINTSVGIRINKVEDIYHRTSGFEKKYHKGTSTIGCFVEDYLKEYDNYRFSVNKEGDLKNVVAVLLEIFEKVALPYFDKYDNLELIDKLLNSDPNEQTVHKGNTAMRAHIGIIVARLVGNVKYPELVESYHDIIGRTNKGFYKSEYEALVKDLENLSID
ncbi:MAG: hypothetical protein RIB63_07165 [Fulvivirga sp.]